MRFDEEAQKDPALEDEGRAVVQEAIEDGDEEALSIFNWFKELTLKDAARVYDMLGVTFDSYAGESFYNDKMQPVIEELREKGLLVEIRGRADRRSFGIRHAARPSFCAATGPRCTCTRDLAAAQYRQAIPTTSTKCLYVVAYQQDLHFTAALQDRWS